MKRIEITFKKNSTGKYDYTVIQNGKVFFKKEYSAKSKDETGLTQAEVFSAFSRYLQDLVDEELAKNPDFHWDSFSDFKAFEGAKTQHMFWEHEADYIDYPKA